MCAVILTRAQRTLSMYFSNCLLESQQWWSTTGWSIVWNEKKTQTARKDWNFRATSTKIIKICIHKIIDTLWKTRRVAHKNGSPCINYMNHWIWTELICKCNFKNANCKCKHTFTWNATAVALLLLPFLQMLYNSSYQFHM